MIILPATNFTRVFRGLLCAHMKCFKILWQKAMDKFTSHVTPLCKMRYVKFIFHSMYRNKQIRKKILRPLLCVSKTFHGHTKKSLPHMGEWDKHYSATVEMWSSVHQDAWVRHHSCFSSLQNWANFYQLPGNVFIVSKLSL